jgi:predicted O-methyltransferase YrrM
MFARSTLRNLRDNLLKAAGLPSRTQMQEHHFETMYHQCFLDMKASLGITRAFVPFKGAANASLLYLVARSLTELDLRDGLELGCGQSTLLMDGIVRNGASSMRLTSIENDPFWAEKIQKEVAHPVVLRPLKEQVIRGKGVAFYDLGDTLAGRTFDFLLVDGPWAGERNNRWGCLDIIDRHLKEDFLIIFDDHQRAGEVRTCAAALSLLESKGVKALTHRIAGVKSQFIIATERMGGACFF